MTKSKMPVILEVELRISYLHRQGGRVDKNSRPKTSWDDAPKAGVGLESEKPFEANPPAQNKTGHLC